MHDMLTKQIIEQLTELPIAKKKAILELIRNDSPTARKHDASFKEQWRKDLLTTSVWTEAEINEIKKAREYINQWKPKQFF